MVAVAPLQSIHPDTIRVAGRIVYKTEISPEQVDALRRVLPARGLSLRESTRWYTVAALCAHCGGSACAMHDEKTFRALLGDDDKWVAVLNDLGGVQFFVEESGSHYSVEEVGDIYGTDGTTIAKIIGEQMVEAAQNERPEGWW